jgi:hypothetical protein
MAITTTHGYGRRERRGSRYNHNYDDIILNFMVDEQIRFAKDNIVRGGNIPGPYFKPQSLSKLFDVVKTHGCNTVSWSTVQEHLRDLKREHILVRGPKKGSYQLSKTKVKVSIPLEITTVR